MAPHTVEPMRQGVMLGEEKAVVVDGADTDGSAVAGVGGRASAAAAVAAPGVVVAGNAAAAGDGQVEAGGLCLMIEVVLSRTRGRWSRE